MKGISQFSHIQGRLSPSAPLGYGMNRIYADRKDKLLGKKAKNKGDI